MIKAMNELTLSSYGNLRQQIRAARETRQTISQEQDKLLLQLCHIDNIERTLTELEQSAD